MKIDFFSPYRDIKVLLEAPAAKGITDQEGFISDLNQAIAGDGKSPEKRNVLVKEAPLGLPILDQLRASIRLPDALTMSPSPRPVSPPPEITNDVSESPPSVKTPTIKSAERIASSDPFNRMSFEQRISEVRGMVEQAGNQHGVDPLLGLAVVAVESSFNPHAVSSDGHASKGLMQLLDSTGHEVHQANGGNRHTYNPFDPGKNILLGVSHLRSLLDMFSDATQIGDGLSTVAAENSSSQEKFALAAYNAGQGRVASAQARATRAGSDASKYDNVEPYLPDSTQEYVKKVLAQMRSFERHFG